MDEWLQCRDCSFIVVAGLILTPFILCSFIRWVCSQPAAAAATAARLLCSARPAKYEDHGHGGWRGRCWGTLFNHHHNALFLVCKHLGCWENYAVTCNKPQSWIFILETVVYLIHPLSMLVAGWIGCSRCFCLLWSRRGTCCGGRCYWWFHQNVGSGTCKG